MSKGAKFTQLGNPRERTFVYFIPKQNSTNADGCERNEWGQQVCRKIRPWRSFYFGECVACKRLLH